MYFIDLNRLKIIKDFKHDTQEFYIENDLTYSYKVLVEQVDQLLDSILKENPLSVHYIIHLDSSANNETATEEEEDSFLSVVNVICAEFFAYQVSKDEIRRNRDYRLDVPDKLKGVHTSYSLIKKAINFKTINDVFNLTVTYKNLIFSLCDTTDLPQDVDFKHDVEELEGTDE